MAPVIQCIRGLADAWTVEMPKSIVIFFLIVLNSYEIFSKSVRRREAFVEYADAWYDETEPPFVLPCQCVSVFECGLAWKYESGDEEVENPCKNVKEVCCERKKDPKTTSEDQKDRVVIPNGTDIIETQNTSDYQTSHEYETNTNNNEENKKGSCNGKKEKDNVHDESADEGQKEIAESDSASEETEESPNCVCVSPLKCGATWRSGDDDEEEEVGLCTNPKEVCCYNFGPKKEQNEPEPLQCGKTHSIPFTPPASQLTEDTAKFGEFPWIVLLLNSRGQGFCTGTLVHNHAVVTAAHCLNKMDKADVTVRAGDWNILDEYIEPLGSQERGIKLWMPHPKFEEDYPPNDVAIVILDEPFTAADNINKICLPYSMDDLDSSQCVEAGWGKYPGGKQQHTQVKIPVELVSNRDCRKLLRKTQLGRYFQLDKSFTCARNEDRKELCEGNGGGPLICPSKDTGSMTLIGISSWGVGCGQGNPSAFTDISYVSEWLTEVLRENNAI